MEKRRLWMAVLCSALAGVIVAGEALAEGKSDAQGRVLEKIVIIHYRRGHAKPPWAGGGGGKPPKEESGDYTYLSNGAKWKSAEQFVVNPLSGQGLDKDLLPAAVTLGMVEWETAAGKQIFGDPIEINVAAVIDPDRADGKNVIAFGDYPVPGVIAVAIVWGYFTGPPGSREIVEADILFDEVDFEWGNAAANPAIMDVLNIATHELGHCAGMGDLYDPAANLETMYGYSAEGEIIKRDLYIGDIEGIQKLYK